MHGFWLRKTLTSFQQESNKVYQQMEKLEQGRETSKVETEAT